MCWSEVEAHQSNSSWHSTMRYKTGMVGISRLSFVVKNGLVAAYAHPTSYKLIWKKNA